jgi:hypothetical protein
MLACRLGKRTELDTGAFVVDMGTFGLVGELEIRKALRLRYPVAVVVIKPTQALEEQGQRFLERVARRVSTLVRQTDLVAVASKRPPALYVLLVDALLSDLEGIMTRISRQVHRHLAAGSGDDEWIRISLGGACFPSTATSWPDLVSQAECGATGPA